MVLQCWALALEDAGNFGPSCRLQNSAGSLWPLRHPQGKWCTRYPALCHQGRSSSLVPCWGPMEQAAPHHQGRWCSESISFWISALERAGPDVLDFLHSCSFLCLTTQFSNPLGTQRVLHIAYGNDGKISKLPLRFPPGWPECTAVVPFAGSI